MARSLVAPVVVALALSATSARAGDDVTVGAYTLDPHALPDYPAPPSIPDLTHRALWVGLEQNLAWVTPHPDADGSTTRAFGSLTRLEGELTLVSRRWYVGLAEEMAFAKPPGGDSTRVLLGYPEIWTRAVWASRAGLSYGGGLSLVIPVFHRAPDSSAATVSEGVRVVRPWDFAAFADNTFTATPFLDARVVDGSVTFQLRQGLGFQDLVASAHLPSANLTSRTTLFLGYRPIDPIGLGLELWEVYFISADIPDYQRAVFAISPSIRLMTRALQPALSVIVPFERTLYDRVETYWAARLSVAAVIDDSPKLAPRAEENAARAEIGEELARADEERVVDRDARCRRALDDRVAHDRAVDEPRHDRCSGGGELEEAQLVLRVAIDEEREVAPRRQGAIVCVDRELVDGPSEREDADVIRDRHRPVERELSVARRLAVARRRARFVRRDLVAREVERPTWERRVVPPARRGPRDELAGHVAEIVRLRRALLVERCRFLPKTRPEARLGAGEEIAEHLIEVVADEAAVRAEPRALEAGRRLTGEEGTRELALVGGDAHRALPARQRATASS